VRASATNDPGNPDATEFWRIEFGFAGKLDAYLRGRLHMTHQFVLGVVMVILIGAGAAEVTVVDRPATAPANSLYVSNKAPLQPSGSLSLAPGVATPAGRL